jgi:multisite-specific tRNA:(cytosine-C5)-methyltransferase
MGKKRNFKKRDRDEATAPIAYKDFEDVDKQNAVLESYYAKQEIVPPEELQEIFKAFREPLPTTFRVTGSRAYAHASFCCPPFDSGGRTMQETNHTIKDDYVPFLTGVVFEGNNVEPPTQIPWFALARLYLLL